LTVVVAVTVLLFPRKCFVPAELNFGTDSLLNCLSPELELELSLFCYLPFVDWIKGTYLDTTAASVFVTVETPL
jgi:hypothetical protein